MQIGGSSPRASVVIATFNRGPRVEQTVATVLAQRSADVEVVVVDDGSTDDTPARLAALRAQGVVVVTQDNAGLGAARNTGWRSASGEWIVFLDDDDAPRPDWLATLLPGDDADGLALSCCAAHFVAPDGSDGGGTTPSPMQGTDRRHHVSYMAGTFAVRRSVLAEVGGYLEGLGVSHQFELMIRMLQHIETTGLGVRSTDRIGIDIERRPATDRAMLDAKQCFEGGSWVLERHHSWFAADKEMYADNAATVGVHAMRAGRPAEGRQLLWAAAKAAPTVTRVARAVAGSVPALAARRWPVVAERARRSGIPNHLDVKPGDAGAGCELFLPAGYREHPVRSSDADGTPFWEGGEAENDLRYQEAVYQWAAKLAAAAGTPVVDVGCGTGHKLVRRVAPATSALVVGADQPSAIGLARQKHPGRRWIEGDIHTDAFWSEITDLDPGGVGGVAGIAPGDDPVFLLRRLHGAVAHGARLLVSTPDRSKLDDADPLGPPRNPRHVREWSATEFALLLEACGFDVVDQRHFLPRAYSPTLLDLKRTVHRALHGRAVPDHRSSMAFLCEARPR